MPLSSHSSGKEETNTTKIVVTITQKEPFHILEVKRKARKIKCPVFV